MPNFSTRAEKNLLPYSETSNDIFIFNKRPPSYVAILLRNARNILVFYNVLPMYEIASSP